MDYAGAPAAQPGQAGPTQRTLSTRASPTTSSSRPPTRSAPGCATAWTPRTRPTGKRLGPQQESRQHHGRPRSPPACERAAPARARTGRGGPWSPTTSSTTSEAAPPMFTFRCADGTASCTPSPPSTTASSASTPRSTWTPPRRGRRGAEGDRGVYLRNQNQAPSAAFTVPRTSRHRGRWSSTPPGPRTSRVARWSSTGSSATMPTTIRRPRDRRRSEGDEDALGRDLRTRPPTRHTGRAPHRRRAPPRRSASSPATRETARDTGTQTVKIP